MGDKIFFVTPVLATLKKKYPDCKITFVTAWGYKDKKGRWGKRNQDGFCISLMMTSPHIDELIHWHDTKLSLDKNICKEQGKSFATWNKEYFEKEKASGKYDAVYELDFGIGIEDNPMEKMYEHLGLPEETYSKYETYLTDEDKKVAEEVMRDYPHPRIVLLEGLEGTSTRGWDPEKIQPLTKAIEKKYGVQPIWFGGKHNHEYKGRTLTLRENIATLSFCDVAIGVMSGPMHFAGAVDLPTITLYCDQPLHRAAPAYFLNKYIKDEKKHHRTILGPTGKEMKFLKEGTTQINLTEQEMKDQKYKDWNKPGKQSTKSCLSVITPDEVMTVLEDVIG